MVEHAVAAALVEDGAWPRLLGAIGEGLGWHYGGAWLPQAGAVRCVATWTEADPALTRFAQASQRLVLAFGEGLPGRVQASAAPAWIADVEADENFPRRTIAAAAGLRSAFAIPLAGGGALEFLSTAALAPDDDLLSTLTSVGRRIGGFMEQRESEARKRAMLDTRCRAGRRAGRPRRSMP
jgi:bHLH-MYC/R2R3-MYB transcription factor-like protein